MAEKEGGQDRTEAPTPRRLERAREQGQVAQSRELAGWAALGAATLAAWVALPNLGLDLMRALRGTLARAHELEMAPAGGELLRLGVLAVLPVALAAAAGAALATLVQTRGLVSAKPMAPSLTKLSSLAGAKRILGPDGLAEFVRALLKLLIVGLALWHAAGDLGALQAALHRPAGAMLGDAAHGALRLMAATLVAFGGIAALDLLWVRFRHEQTLRMSRQDLKEEAKEAEGDPHRRARMRQLRQERGRRRMMAEVPKAAVVVTNPTHYAVALSYAGGAAAPRVVAKGVDAVAARIREAADVAGVPRVANPPLARALWRVELDAEIPAEHYQAVAEIIAYVWRLRGQAGTIAKP
jgi:flagellar biosynthetic protein FlhB